MNDLDRIAEIMTQCPVNQTQLDKPKHIYAWITKLNAQVSVEIGVFGGTSFIAAAVAMEKTGGIAYGIDPWMNAEAMQEGYPAVNATIPGMPFPVYYQKLNRVLKNNKLFNTRLIRAKSQETSELFDDGEIDFIHIDGNHGAAAVLQDAELYVPKVRKGGIIWFDDVLWDSVTPAVRHAMKSCKHVCRPSSNDVMLEKTC